MRGYFPSLQSLIQAVYGSDKFYLSQIQLSNQGPPARTTTVRRFINLLKSYRPPATPTLASPSRPRPHRRARKLYKLHVNNRLYRPGAEQAPGPRQQPPRARQQREAAYYYLSPRGGIGVQRWGWAGLERAVALMG